MFSCILVILLVLRWKGQYKETIGVDSNGIVHKLEDPKERFWKALLKGHKKKWAGNMIVPDPNTGLKVAKGHDVKPIWSGWFYGVAFGYVLGVGSALWIIHKFFR